METIEITCSICQKAYTISAPKEEFMAWKSGVLIQRAMKSLTDDQRELLISQTCGRCFDEMFKDMED